MDDHYMDVMDAPGFPLSPGDKDVSPPPLPTKWYRSWRVCRLTGFVSVPARPGARYGGHAVDLAHVFPRRLATDEEKNDPANVIAMVGWLHRGFDASWWTTDHYGRVIFDKRLPYDLQKRMVGLSISEYSPENERYMRRHRQWALRQGLVPKRTLPL